VRFRLAATAIAYHELALAGALALVAWLVWGEPNQTALHVFGLLWVMRLSTKLNIFLGAPNLPVAFLPPHLGYLASYFRRAPMNAFFPLSITAATLVTGWLAHAAWTAPAGSFTGMSHAVLAVLMALAVLEHWLLMLPIPSTFLWGWGLRSRRLGAAAPVEPTLLRQFEPLPNPARVTKSGLGRPA
jgi:putative photosynthetic complex assembly protein 2